MNMLKFCLLLTLAALPCTLYAGDSIYRWVDDQGAVHYGDTVPDKYKDRATRKPELKDHPVIDTAAPERARSLPAAPESPGTMPKPDAAPALPVAGTENVAPTPDMSKLSCEQQWEVYYDSQACFAPYRNANASVRAEAFDKCQVIAEPPRCE